MIGSAEYRRRVRPLFPVAFELFCAVDEGTVADVEARLQAGDNPNALAINGQSPIMLAVRSRLALPKAELLLSFGATLDVWDKHGHHAIHRVTGSSYDRHLESLAWILRHGVDPNVVTRPARESFHFRIGWTPLHIAAYQGFYDATELLLQHHASVHITDEHGATALHVSVSRTRAYKKLARALLDSGADPNAQDAAGNTPLHLLAKGHSRYRKTVMELLLSRKARLDLGNQKGHRPGDLVPEGFPATETIRKLFGY